MSDWTAGYVADIGYTYGYYPELNPQRAKLMFLNAGLACPEFGHACELGFGQGLGTNIHAAASTVKWHGTDFIPSQASFAQELAKASGASANLYDESFAEFAARQDLPDFDYIGLHGIWSWISEENREVIVDFVRRKLKVGGVLFVSYNTLPGWSAFAPMRHLMTEHARHVGSEAQGIVKRIDGALEFGEKLLASNPVYGRVNTSVAGRLQKIKDMNRHYLAHEYFNEDWQPMYFSDFAEQISRAKMTFVCSAHPHDAVDSVNFTAEQQKFMGDISDPLFKETVRDYMVNQQFRRDFWVKGARKITNLERDKGLSNLRVMLISHRSDVSLKVTGGMGELNLRDDVYNPILDSLANHEIKTLGELARELTTKGIIGAQLPEALMMLAGVGHVVVVQSDEEIDAARETAGKLNFHLMQKARSNNEINYLASPVTGGGVSVGRFQQLFILSRKAGSTLPAEWANFAWQQLKKQGQRLLKDGTALQDEADNLAELTRQAKQFEEKNLPILIKLGIA